MANSPDHPQLRFVQAKGYTRGRPDGPPLWIVVHDMEASEHSARAENTAAYFANPGDGRGVSSHYCVDDNSVIQCVRLRDSAWTVGNRPGNNRGINWELSGFARQTRAQWLDPFGRAMFAQAAPIIRADAARYGIPLRRCTIADLRAFRRGVTSHNDLRIAFGGTTHTDPGPNFPWDEFLRVINKTPEEEVAITNEDADLIGSRLLGRTLGSSGPLVAVALQDGYRDSKAALAQVVEVGAELAALRALVEAAGGSVDVAAVLAGVDERLAAHRAAVEADTRDAVADLAEGGAPAVRADAE